MISVLVFPLVAMAIAGRGEATERDERLAADAATEY